MIIAIIIIIITISSSMITMNLAIAITITITITVTITINDNDNNNNNNNNNDNNNNNNNNNKSWLAKFPHSCRLTTSGDLLILRDFRRFLISCDFRRAPDRCSFFSYGCFLYFAPECRPTASRRPCPCPCRACRRTCLGGGESNIIQYKIR